LHGVHTLPLEQRVHGQNHQRKNGHAVNLNRQRTTASDRETPEGLLSFPTCHSAPHKLEAQHTYPTQDQPYTGQALGSALHCHVKYLPHSTSNATTKPTSTHRKHAGWPYKKGPPITHSTVAPPSLTVQSLGTLCQTRLSCTTVVELCPV
jgi:hypothetical protein